MTATRRRDLRGLTVNVIDAAGAGFVAGGTISVFVTPVNGTRLPAPTTRSAFMRTASTCAPLPISASSDTDGNAFRR